MIVPELLDMVFREYGTDSVVSSFIGGMHSGNSWWGNGSEEFRKKAKNTKQFLTHPNPTIRAWAKHEIESLNAMADREDMYHAEQFLPD